jgi:hypothetical protein
VPVCRVLHDGCERGDTQQFLCPRSYTKNHKLNQLHNVTSYIHTKGSSSYATRNPEQLSQPSFHLQVNWYQSPESLFGWRSVSLGVEPLLGLMTRFLVLHGDYYGLCPLGAPSLTRGWVCHLSAVFVMSLRLFTLVYTLYTIRYVQGLRQSRLCEEDYALFYLSYAMTTASHLNGRRPDRRQV